MLLDSVINELGVFTRRNIYYYVIQESEVRMRRIEIEMMDETNKYFSHDEWYRDKKKY